MDRINPDDYGTCTLDEAKAHWNAHTKKVITKHTEKILKKEGKKWGVLPNGVPYLCTKEDDTPLFYFYAKSVQRGTFAIPTRFFFATTETPEYLAKRIANELRVFGPLPEKKS